MRESPQAGLAAVASMGDWRARVLVVDDTLETRYHIVRILKQEGYEIFEAADGAGALKAVLEHRPDLLVLDVKMPDMLGFEVVEQLRRDPETAHVGILHLSATFTGADAQAMGLSKGADAYLTHPVEPAVLLATVRALLRIQQYEIQLVELLERERVARTQAERALQIADRVEVALHLSQRRLLRLSESGIIGLAYWDRNGAVFDANDAFLHMVERSREDLKNGQITLPALTPASWADTGRAILEEVRLNGVSAHHEMQLRRKSGGPCDVLVASASLEDGKGLLVTLDISARKRTENERARLFAELEESLRGRDEFLAMAAHDLRSPLGALQLKVDLLSQLSQRPDGITPQELYKQLGGAQGQIKQLTSLLDRLLDTTRIRFGQTSIQWEEVDLGQAVRDSAEQLREQARRSNTGLVMELAPGIVGTWDRIRIEQVVINLLSNAIKYGPGKPVTVRVTGDEKIGRIEVKDQGPGITPEDQARMFSAFERGASRDEKGFGLGLWIVRRIIDAMGGDIWAQSGSDIGTTFTVTLPRKRADSRIGG
jgi:signal transduction histidine kinase